MLRILGILMTALAVAAVSARPLAAQQMPQDAEAAAHARAAQEAAEAWLELIAAQRYAESWEQASTPFRQAVSAEVWAQQVGGVRGQVGALRSRRLESAQYATDLPNAPAGEYVVLTYASSFEGLPAAREVVTMLREEGRWRLAGYFVQPA